MTKNSQNTSQNQKKSRTKILRKVIINKLFITNKYKYYFIINIYIK
jgi:hypothetical protein